MWKSGSLPSFQSTKLFSPESWFFVFLYLSQEVKIWKHHIFSLLYSQYFPAPPHPLSLCSWPHAVNTQKVTLFQGLYVIPSWRHIIRISQPFLSQISILEIKVLKDPVPHTRKHRRRVSSESALGATWYALLLLPWLKLPPVSKAVLMDARHTISFLNYTASFNLK